MKHARKPRLTLPGEAQSRDDEFDHATSVVAGAVLSADTEIADAPQQFVGVHAGTDLASLSSGVEQLSAHGHEAVEEVGVQGLEGGIVGLQRLGEAVLGDQEVDEEVFRMLASGTLLRLFMMPVWAPPSKPRSTGSRSRTETKGLVTHA